MIGRLVLFRATGDLAGRFLLSALACTCIVQASFRRLVVEAAVEMRLPRR